MDAVVSDSEHLFSLPVALIFRNESDMEEPTILGYNTTRTATVNVSQDGQGWKKEGSLLSGLQRQEKVADVIRRELKWAFILHTYGFGCLFFVLAFYTFFSILNIRSFISSRPFMSTINGFLCLLGATRAMSLFIDPYNLKENMPKTFSQVLWDLGFPSILSAFCLVQLAFLQFTQLQVGPEGFRRKSCLSLIVTAHFLLTIGTDIIVSSHENFLIVKHVIHYVFLTWGVFLCSNFLYTGYKVMSMIRSIPGGLKHRELPDPSYKGIMQLAILAPHNNLAGSMTAALLPTLCTPKIHQKDNTGLSAVGFRSDGNLRILESESIPMLEEMTGSSGDETSPKILARGSSFQNQTRNSHKHNLRPKLSFRSISDDLKEDELAHAKQKSPKSATPKNLSPKISSVKASEFDFNVKPILKHGENIPTVKNAQAPQIKIQYKNCIENENFRFSKEKKPKSSSGEPSAPATIDNLIPEILVSTPLNSKNGKDVNVNFGKPIGNEHNKKNLSKLINEISNDLNEMQILREEKEAKMVNTEETGQSESSCSEVENEKPKDKAEVKKSCECKRGNQTCGNECRKSDSRKETKSGSLKATAVKGLDNFCPESGENSETERTRTEQQKIRGRRKGKSLSWKKKIEDEKDEKATQECLLPQENSANVNLKTVLNHIAYKSKTVANNEDDLEKVKKSKIEWVLNITYITAMWGLMLCLSNMGKIYSPFGLPEPHKGVSSLNSTYSRYEATSEPNASGILFSSWPWLWFQTFCRALELAMGCAMANITRQPAANHRYPRTPGFRQRDIFYNI